MKLKSLAVAVCLIISSQFVNAQIKVNDLVKEWERSKAYTKEYLEAMPDSGYALKPTPEMRSFAQQVLHLADANYGLVSAAIGMNSPFGHGELEKTGDKSKSNVSRLVLSSYDFVIDHITKLTETQMNETVKMLGSYSMSRSMALAKAFEHQVHHRGQTTVYLRLAGVIPPQEKLF